MSRIPSGLISLRYDHKGNSLAKLRSRSGSCSYMPKPPRKLARISPWPFFSRHITGLSAQSSTSASL